MSVTVSKRENDKGNDLTSCVLSKTEGDEEKFEDAYEMIPVATTMNLKSSLEECTTGLYLFLNNRFSDAISLIHPWSKTSIYHALIYNILMVVKAVLTFDPQDIQTGMATAKEALKTCNNFRRKSRMMNFSHLVSKQGIKTIKEEELHAEVCYAECLILKSTVTFIQDDSMLGFLKCAINIGLSYQIYKDCQQVLTQMPNNHSKTYRHLVEGVKFGLGAFNLLLSLVPPKTLKLLNIVGYFGDREVGLTLLHESASKSHINNILSVLTLVFYYTYIYVAIGAEKGHSSAVEDLFLIYLQKFPNCVILKFFQARFSMLKGNFENARLILEECIFIQNEWKQVHHLCYWELMWCHIFLRNWKQAHHYADLLSRNSRWSKAIYMYSKAMLLSLLPSDSVKSVSEDISSLFLKVDRLRIKILGTSVPIEKFIAEKGQRYGTTTGWFTAQPILEFIYAWSGFRVMSKKLDLISSWLSIIDKGEDLLRKNPNTEYGTDDISLLNLLKGLCLKHLGRYSMAECYFNRVLQKEKLLKYDHYLVPYTYYELGILYYLKGDYDSATKNLDNIKNYKDYSMEARLQFRAHIALEQIAKEK
ncbi:tetratricopeptide repeat protein 39B-like [Prionailurus viverrinus]|uniref:tetratricopeptide repeat protein 39B-like n=1 Tax=Prionailurus bengalensis TaxID=37029 RepID=UPI001CA9F1CB|nr:tetratricopeptide repeat protein 39B-like [Prionailurus bengalensis]XP_043460063.1 tetratricopeptide repeat protein 39B-like [Prionailurus bengalensis]XP_043460065.1 tetratricopeptide repeat protein 39B-like [Prionailurus bengalensis]XP_047709344.1 tetratricopeptide repeat protein 39B-like [Prionailurus viverrinus]XP_047709345.1 tetratricopeptide repeat protein 39B-like [Prionailurus viverrinus]XP_047709346.1 tetratricopeptide repeat protein 39B-like [Prionailurus viverrinus]XP_047709347.1